MSVSVPHQGSPTANPGRRPPAASLKRLGMEYVDLIYCHRPDPETPVEETVRAMNWVWGARGPGRRQGGAGPVGRTACRCCVSRTPAPPCGHCHQGSARPARRQAAGAGGSSQQGLACRGAQPCAGPACNPWTLALPCHTPPNTAARCAGAGPGHGLLLGHQRVVAGADRGGLGGGRPAGPGWAGCASVCLLLSWLADSRQHAHFWPALLDGSASDAHCLAGVWHTHRNSATPGSISACLQPDCAHAPAASGAGALPTLYIGFLSLMACSC